MRGFAIVCVGALALAACQKKDEAAKTGEAPAAVATAPAAPSGQPKLKAGFWTQKISAEGMNQEIKLCLDEATAAKMNMWGAQQTDDMCAKNVVTPAPGGWAFESECDMGGGGGKVVTKGTATGDLGSSYTVKASSTTTGSSMPQANGTREMTMTATWAAACPPGMKPGDMAIPGGGTINMSQIEAMQKKAMGK